MDKEELIEYAIKTSNSIKDENDSLNDEIEIIEEDKKIKKLEPISGSELVDLRDKDQIKSNKSLTYLILKLNEMNKKINELLYEINKMIEKKK